MDKKKIIIIAGAAAVMVALVLFIVFGAQGKQYKNTLSLIKQYIERGEYQRAMDYLDKLLIKNPNDSSAQALFEETIKAVRLERAGSQDPAAAAPDGTDGGSLNSDLAAAGLAAQLDAVLAAQREAALAVQRQAALTAQMDATLAAQEAARAEERAQEAAREERKKAEMEEIARKSRAVQEAMRAVNDLVSQGRAALEKGDFSGASTAFKDALSRVPEGETRFEASKQAEIAEAYYDNYARDRGGQHAEESLKEAIQHARTSLQKDDTLAPPHYVLGKVNRDLRQWDNAIAEFKEALRLDENNYVYSFELGRGYFVTRKYADARRVFDNTIRLKRDFEPAWYNLGGTLRQLGRQDEALAAYRQAVDIKADYGPAHREIGRVLYAKGDFNAAADAFAKALQANPNDTESLRELGVAKSGAGDYAAAEAAFERVLKVSPNDDLTNYNMAVVKIGLGKNAEALVYAKKASAAKPQDAVYQYTLGLAAQGADDVNGAIAAYSQAANLDSRYIRPRINLGKLYIENNMADKALDVLLEAYAIDPVSFEVNNNLGAAYSQKDDWNKSITHYEAALRAVSTDSAVWMNLAKAHVGAGNLGAAKDAYMGVLKNSPQNWDAMLELGKTCAAMGDSEEAKRHLSDLIRRNPGYSNRTEAERILVGL